MTSESRGFEPRHMRPRKSILAVADAAWNDLGDLVQAELQLLRAEISEKLKLTVLSASLIGSGIILLIATLVLLLQAAIGALVVLGLSWLTAILALAAATLVLGGGLVWFGYNNLTQRLMPARTLGQIQKDVKTLTGLE
jgi:putative superfamily III holin-X